MQKNSSFSRRRFLQMSLAAAGGLAVAGFPLKRLAAQASGFQGTADFWDWEYAPRQAYMQQLITEWQAENPGITLNYTTFPYGDLGTKLLTANEAEQNPPISNVHADWRPALQRAGLLAPYPEDLFDFSKLASTPFLSAMDGRVHTSTFGYYCTITFLNNVMLQEEGLTAADVPTKWEDFVLFAKQLTRYDASGNVERPGIGLNHYYSQKWLWQDLIYQAGGFQYNEEGTQALWNSAEGVQALQLISDWYHVHKIDDPLLERHFDMFYTERSAGFLSHGYWSGDLIADEAWEGKFSTVPEPTWTGSATPSWGLTLPEEGIAVFANYPDEEKAALFSFIQYVLGTDERRIQWAKVHAIPTDRVDLLSDPRLLEGDEGNVLKSAAVTIPYRVNAGEQPLEADTYLREMFERVILNAEEPKAVLDDVTTRYNTFLTEQGDQNYLITERSYVAPTQ